MPVFNSPKPNIIVKSITRFPANIVSAEGVKLEKGDGNYVFSLDYPNLSPASEISIPSHYTVAVYNRDKNIYEEVRLDDIPLRDATSVKTSVGDTNYTIPDDHYYIALTASLTVTRTWTLPVASHIPGGNRIRIQDESGGINGSRYLTIVPNTGDTINGASSYTLIAPYEGIDFVSNGTNGWTRVQGQKGDKGNTGEVPWLAPVPWVQNTNYVVGPPSSCITLNGGTYVCKTAHNSGTTFDVSKWQIISDPGNYLAAQAASAAAATSATSANNSYLAAATSAGESATSASNALSSKASAETAATNAASSASTATTKASDAAASAASATTSASTATTKAAEASTSATSAASSASTATTQASAASTSATNAATSATLSQDWATKTSAEVVSGQGYGAKKYANEASSSATAASSSASSASSSASTATTKAGEAASSATSASTSASTATTKASEASTYASNAASSATASASSATAAAASATDAAASAVSASWPVLANVVIMFANLATTTISTSFRLYNAIHY